MLSNVGIYARFAKKVADPSQLILSLILIRTKSSLALARALVI